MISWRIIRCDLVKLRTVSFRGGCAGGRGRGRKGHMGIQQMGVQTHTLSLSSFEILGKHMVVGKRYSSASTVSTSSRLLLPLLLSSLPGCSVGDLLIFPENIYFPPLLHFSSCPPPPPLLFLLSSLPASPTPPNRLISSYSRMGSEEKFDLNQG